MDHFQTKVFHDYDYYFYFDADHILEDAGDDEIRNDVGNESIVLSLCSSFRREFRLRFQLFAQIFPIVDHELLNR